MQFLLAPIYYGKPKAVIKTVPIDVFLINYMEFYLELKVLITIDNLYNVNVYHLVQCSA